MGESSFEICQNGAFPVIKFKNYCNNETLESLGAQISELCDNDKTKLIFDFSECQVVNSLGLATILEVLLIAKDYEGKVVITGLDSVKTRFFSLTGVFSIAENAPSNKIAEDKLRAS